jgi:agmatine/peptidylarginine deiminase
LVQADQNFLALAKEISDRENLVICCYDEAHRHHIESLLAAARVPLERVRCYVIPSDDSWSRDHGPITVYRDGQPVLLHFRFNGWGEKYPWERDDLVAERLHLAGAFGNTPLEKVNLILEGGSIESDGQGTLLITRQCLLAANRNGLPQGKLESCLRELLGSERFLWLHHGYLEGDDTDAHIDTLARFCDPETIAYQACEDEQDSHFLPLQAMAAELATFRTRAGKPYRLIPLPLPKAIIDPASKRRLPASYANFLILNGAVLVPLYDHPSDGVALQRLQACFPERQVIGIPCRTLIRQYGSLHCVTMQLSQGVQIG